MSIKKLGVAPLTNEIRFGTVKPLKGHDNAYVWQKYDVISKDEFENVIFQYFSYLFDSKKGSLGYGFEGSGEIHIIYLPEEDCKDYTVKLVKKEVGNNEQST
jgi:hypothetical protein